MRITMVIPIERYDILIDNCDPSCAEYQLLRNSMIAHNDRGKSAEIWCDFEEAENILVLARQIERGLRSVGS